MSSNNLKSKGKNDGVSVDDDLAKFLDKVSTMIELRWRGIARATALLWFHGGP